jgi:hypothetical protein
MKKKEERDRENFHHSFPHSEVSTYLKLTCCVPGTIPGIKLIQEINPFQTLPLGSIHSGGIKEILNK